MDTTKDQNKINKLQAAAIYGGSVLGRQLGIVPAIPLIYGSHTRAHGKQTGGYLQNRRDVKELKKYLKENDLKVKIDTKTKSKIGPHYTSSKVIKNPRTNEITIDKTPTIVTNRSRGPNARAALMHEGAHAKQFGKATQARMAMVKYPRLLGPAIAALMLSSDREGIQKYAPAALVGSQLPLLAIEYGANAGAARQIQKTQGTRKALTAIKNVLGPSAISYTATTAGTILGALAVKKYLNKRKERKKRKEQ